MPYRALPAQVVRVVFLQRGDFLQGPVCEWKENWFWAFVQGFAGVRFYFLWLAESFFLLLAVRLLAP